MLASRLGSRQWRRSSCRALRGIHSSLPASSDDNTGKGANGGGEGAGEGEDAAPHTPGNWRERFKNQAVEVKPPQPGKDAAPAAGWREKFGATQGQAGSGGKPAPGSSWREKPGSYGGQGASPDQPWSWRNAGSGMGGGSAAQVDGNEVYNPPMSLKGKLLGLRKREARRQAREESRAVGEQELEQAASTPYKGWVHNDQVEGDISPMQRELLHALSTAESEEAAKALGGFEVDETSYVNNSEMEQSIRAAKLQGMELSKEQQEYQEMQELMRDHYEEPRRIQPYQFNAWEKMSQDSLLEVPVTFRAPGQLYKCKGKKQGKPGEPGRCRIINLNEVHPMNIPLLSRFLTEAGMIAKRRNTGLCAKCQRRVAKTIKSARSQGTISAMGNFRIIDSKPRASPPPGEVPQFSSLVIEATNWGAKQQ